MTSWGRFQQQFDGIIQDLKAHEELVDKTVNAVNISEAREMRRELEEKISKDQDERTSAQYLAIAGWLGVDESDQLEIFESIAAGASENADTGSWILKQPKIQTWMRCSQNSTLLLLHGRPGSGKSVLATQIATFLRSGGQSLVVTHICTYSYETSNDYEKILRSIILQLIQSNPDLIAHVHGQLVVNLKTPSSQVLEKLLCELVGALSLAPSQTKYIHLILDGLSECDEERQARIMNMLERIVTAASSSNSTVCKVLLTTQLSRVITKRSRHKQTVSLSDEKESLDGAIGHYTAQRLAALRPRLFQMGISDSDISDIRNRIAEKADGESQTKTKLSEHRFNFEQVCSFGPG